MSWDATWSTVRLQSAQSKSLPICKKTMQWKHWKKTLSFSWTQVRSLMTRSRPKSCPQTTTLVRWLTPGPTKWLPKMSLQEKSTHLSWISQCFMHLRSKIDWSTQRSRSTSTSPRTSSAIWLVAFLTRLWSGRTLKSAKTLSSTSPWSELIARLGRTWQSDVVSSGTTPWFRIIARLKTLWSVMESLSTRIAV